MSTPVVYMMSDHRRQLLYVGAKVDLARRAFEHRNGAIPGFTRRYGLFVLVYYEMHPDIGSALARERLIKHWPRKWKNDLVETLNPGWSDLYGSLNR
jgi:putative endonuclease